MTITFMNTGERSYSTVVERDGILIQVPSYDRSRQLPHDLAHCVVERALGLRRGFWGRVAAGALFPGMVVLEGRRPPRAAERSRQVLHEIQATQSGTEAEVLVGVLEEIDQRGIENDWPAARRMLEQAWRPAHPSRELPDHAEVKRACSALREARREWGALAVGQCLSIEWPHSECGLRAAGRKGAPNISVGHGHREHRTSSRTPRRRARTGQR